MADEHVWDKYAPAEAAQREKLNDAIDGLLFAANGLVAYGVVRWSVRRRGGPDWAGINLGRIAASVAMSPSRKPQARELRESLERAFKDRENR